MEWLAAFVTVVSGLYGLWHFLVRSRRKQKIPAKKNEAYSLVDRFIELFKAHGIERTQVPRFLGDRYNLTLENMSSNEKLLSRLDEALLTSVCELFGVQRDWLDKGDTPIYSRERFYKNMNLYVQFLSDIKQKYDDVQCFAIKSPENKLAKDGKDLSIALLFRGRTGVLDDNPIYRYFISGDEWSWSYGRTRIQLKAMIWAAWQFKILIAGCLLPQDNINDLLAGKVFPGPLVDNLSWVMWHPDDYILTADESQVAADSKEAITAREYMIETGWMDHFKKFHWGPE